MLTPPCAPQLFMDMAVLVESQGELLNQIEHNVEQAVGYVAQGVDELNKVLMWHSKRAEMQCC
jgi:t-SNARE complex subunit (syntaxin)